MIHKRKIFVMAYFGHNVPTTFWLEAKMLPFFVGTGP